MKQQIYRAYKLSSHIKERIIFDLAIYLTRKKPVPGLKYFCQNAGSTGSKYIVELMKANGIKECYHEKKPDLDELGITYFEGKGSIERIKYILLNTRKDVFFEANNRLFSMSKVIHDIFPDSKFIHLHRDGREVVSSVLSKPRTNTWASQRLRYQSIKLCGLSESTDFEKTCHYWANYNRKIYEDLKDLNSISLKFSDLIEGNLQVLEEFMKKKFFIKKISPVNSEKPIRREGKYPSYDKWSENEKKIFNKICSDMMKKLGYW